MPDIFGRNPVREALRNETAINKIWIAKGNSHKGLEEIRQLAKKKQVPVQEIDRKKIDQLFPKENHQGIYASIAEVDYASVEEILAIARAKNEDPLVIILDEIEDPHNLGAILRNAEAFGAHGVIIPKRRAAAVTGTVAKASAGAVSMVAIARVNNINQEIEKLKKAGLWICGTALEGESLYQANLRGPLGIVIGSEGSGMRPLVAKSCDFSITIPMKGKINSLNASVATGIILAEVAKGR